MISKKWLVLIARLALIAPRYMVRNALVVFHSIGRKRKRSANCKRHGTAIPSTLFVELTKKCNLSCEGCISACNEHMVTLNADRMAAVVSEAVELGVNSIIFLGGEPFLCIDQILQTAKKYPYHNFNIVTNGTLFSTENISSLKKQPNVLLFVSLDGDEQLHDMRRGAGSFSKTIQGMRALKRKKIPFIVNCTLSKRNYESVLNTYYAKYLKTIGAYMLVLLPYFSTGCETDNKYKLTMYQKEHLSTELDLINKQMLGIQLFDVFNSELQFGGCRASDRSVTITATGDVAPCPAMTFSVGSINNKSLLSVLQGKLHQEFLQQKELSHGCMVTSDLPTIRLLLDQCSPVYSTTKQIVALNAVDQTANLAKVSSAFFHVEEPVCK